MSGQGWHMHPSGDIHRDSVSCRYDNRSPVLVVPVAEAREAIEEVADVHREMLSGFRIDGPQGPGWYCSCGEAFAGNEPYDREAFAGHLTSRVLAALAAVPPESEEAGRE